MDVIETIDSISASVNAVTRTLESSIATKSPDADLANFLTNLQKLSTVLVELRLAPIRVVTDSQHIRDSIDLLEPLSVELTEFASHIDTLRTSKASWKQESISRLRIKNELSTISERIKLALLIHTSSTSIELMPHLPTLRATLRSRLSAAKSTDGSSWVDAVLTAKRGELKEAGNGNGKNLKSLRATRALSHIIGTCDFQGTVRNKRNTERYTLRYAFPPWISSTVIYLEWHSNTPGGWSLALKTAPVKGYDDKIWRLAQTGDVDGIRHEFERSQASPFTEDPDGRSLLWHAVTFETLDLCAFLLQLGADPLFMSPVTGESPIVAAWNLVVNAEQKENSRAARMTELFGHFAELNNDLLQIWQERRTSASSSTKGSKELNTDIGASGANTDVKDDLGGPQATIAPTGRPLTPVPRSFPNMKLHEQGATDPSNHTGEFETMDPSIDRIMADDTERVKALLAKEADFKATDPRGWTPLHFAASKGDLEGAKSILSAAALKAPYERGAVMQAVPPLYRRELLDARDNGGRSPLTIAIRAQQPKLALFLIEAGAAVDLRDYYGKSPIFHAILFNDENTLDALLDKNCVLSFVGRDEGTIIHTAAQSATISVIETLEVHVRRRRLQGASLALAPPSVNARDEEGRTAKEYINHYDEARAEAFARLVGAVEQFWSNVSPRKSKGPLTTMSLMVPIISGVFSVEAKAERATTANRYKWYQYYFILSLVVLVWIHTVLVYLDIFFLWHRVVGAGLRFLREPVSAGMTRISWVCKCGRYFEEDFVELVPGAATRFERRLRLLAHSKALHNTDTGRDSSLKSTNLTGLPPFTAVPPGQVQPASQTPGSPSTASSPATSGPASSTPNAHNSQQMILPSPNPQIVHAQPHQQPQTPAVIHIGPKWLLVCSRPHKLPTSLSQLDFADVYNDRVMFRNIKEAYRNKKSRWHSLFSFLGVRTIRFVRFSVISHFADVHPPIPDLSTTDSSR